MATDTPMPAWIETADGGRFEIGTTCSFGRATSSDFPLGSRGASRRHAYIHAQQSGAEAEYWLVDLGSTNGTLLNGRRLTLPCRLADGDVIAILTDQFVFRSTSGATLTDGVTTVQVQTTAVCWMLLADVRQFTVLSRDLDPDALSLLMGRWFSRCRGIVDETGGAIDKLLGDGFFAYWRSVDDASGRVRRALHRLGELRRECAFEFRLAVHVGDARVDGADGGSNNLSGPDVIYAFRMERLAARLGVALLLSERARDALPESWQGTPLGLHALPGFEGRHAMFAGPESVGS